MVGSPSSVRATERSKRRFRRNAHLDSGKTAPICSDLQEAVVEQVEDRVDDFVECQVGVSGDNGFDLSP
jgi:hypothetical protein